MDSREYLTEAVANAICECEAEGSTDSWEFAAAVLAVVETLRTPCPECDGAGLGMCQCGSARGTHLARCSEPYLPKCKVCGGTGLGMLAFDEMRGTTRMIDSYGPDGFRYYFRAALLSPDTTETP